MPKTTIKKEVPKPDFVTKEEFNELAKSIKGLSDMLLASKQEAKSDVKKEMPVAFNGNDNKVLSDLRTLINELLGEDFGFELNYPKFDLYVPLEKSNADKSYLAFYKKDKRTKALRGGEGVETIKAWLNVIKKNLNLKK